MTWKQSKVRSYFTNFDICFLLRSVSQFSFLQCQISVRKTYYPVPGICFRGWILTQSFTNTSDESTNRATLRKKISAVHLHSGFIFLFIHFLHPNFCSLTWVEKNFPMNRTQILEQCAPWQHSFRVYQLNGSNCSKRE